MLLTFTVLGKRVGSTQGSPGASSHELTLMCFLIRIYSSGVCDCWKGRFP